MFNTLTAFIVAVVSDEAYAAIEGEELTYQIVKMKDEKNQLAVSEQIRKEIGDNITFSSYPEMYQSMVQSFGALLFAGSFLGLVFFMAMGNDAYLMLYV